MTRAAFRLGLRVAGPALAVWLAGLPAWAQAGKPSPVPMLPGAGSHEPININAGKLDYYDKEQKLIYSGDVVAVQGDSTLKASQLTIFLTKTDPNAPAGSTPAGKPPGGTETAAATTAAAGGAPGAPSGNSSVRHMDAKGPVTLISKDQIGTGDNGTYDRDQNQVTLTGNVTLSQGPNVTRGERLVYDLTSGQAQVFAGKSNPRVSSIFTPGSQEPGQPGAAGASAPAPSKKAAPLPKKKAATARP